MVRICIAVVLGLAAIGDDVARRRISNWIPAAALVTGFALQVSLHGWRGMLSAVLGTLAGASTFLLFYLLGGMGGGDIKLMAGFGAMLGPNGILAASLWTAALGGLLAVSVLTLNSIRRTWSKQLRNVPAVDRKDNRAESIPYAPAIAAGVWISLALGA